MQHLCTQRCQLQHLIIGDGVQLLGILYDTRIGSVNAVYVGVNLAEIRAERCCNGNCGGVRAAAAERSHVAHLVNALETCNNNDAAVIQLCLEALACDTLDAGIRVVAVGLQTDLPAGQGYDRKAQLLDGHRQQRHGDHLAGVEQNVHLTLRRTVVQLGSLYDQIIRGIALRGYNYNNLIACLCGLGNNVRNILQSLGVGNRSAAELLHNKTHTNYVSSLIHGREHSSVPYYSRFTVAPTSSQRSCTAFQCGYCFSHSSCARVM